MYDTKHFTSSKYKIILPDNPFYYVYRTVESSKHFTSLHTMVSNGNCSNHCKNVTHNTSAFPHFNCLMDSIL